MTSTAPKAHPGTTIGLCELKATSCKWPFNEVPACA